LPSSPGQTGHAISPPARSNRSASCHDRPHNDNNDDRHDDDHLDYDYDHGTTTTSSMHSILVAENGSGAGTVTSNPAGISCPSTCSASFAEGTNVQLTAAPTGTDQRFLSWGGPCSGSTATCDLTVTAGENVTATFGHCAASYPDGLHPASAARPRL